MIKCRHDVFASCTFFINKLWSLNDEGTNWCPMAVYGQRISMFNVYKQTVFVCFRHNFLRRCLPILLKKQHFVDFRTIIYVLFAVCSSTLFIVFPHLLQYLFVDFRQIIAIIGTGVPSLECFNVFSTGGARGFVIGTLHYMCTR